MRRSLLGTVLAAGLVAGGPAMADCTFGGAQRLMAQAMQAFQVLQQRDPQKARRVEAEVQRRMANAPNTDGRVQSDDSPIPDAVCDFWEDVLDLVED
jgi:hypothetical protein